MVKKKLLYVAQIDNFISFSEVSLNILNGIKNRISMCMCSEGERQIDRDIERETKRRPVVQFLTLQLLTKQNPPGKCFAGIDCQTFSVKTHHKSSLVLPIQC